MSDVVRPAMPAPLDAPAVAKSGRKTGLRRYFSNPSAALGTLIVLVVIALAIVGPAVSPYDPTAMAPVERLLPPGAPGHLLGTDQVGRDVLTRLMDGGRRTLLIGAVPMGFALLVGTTLGLVAGFYGGWPDQVIMRSVDLLFAFPAILLAIAIVAALGPGLADTIIAITIVEIPAVARIARAPVLSLREHEFVQAARVLGASDRRIVLRHIGPNLISPLVVFASVEMGGIIIFGAGLSFLGLGAQAPQAEWGLMMSEGRDALAIAPAVATIPGLAILVLVLGLSLLGDGLREWLDPRSAG